MAIQQPQAPTRFYYKLMGQIVGPMTGKQLRQAAVDCDIDQFTPVRVDEDSEWVPASRLTKLFHKDGTPIRFEELGASPSSVATMASSSVSLSNDFLSLISEIEAHPRKSLHLFDLNFQEFVTPRLVKILYLLSIAGSVFLIGLSFYLGFTHSQWLASGEPTWKSRIIVGSMSALVCLACCSLLLIAVRVVLESILVFFRTCKHLENMARITARGVH